MPEPIDTDRQLHLEKCKKALEKTSSRCMWPPTSNWPAYSFKRISPESKPKTAAWGDSMGSWHRCDGGDQGRDRYRDDRPL